MTNVICATDKQDLNVGENDKVLVGFLDICLE